MSDNSHIQIQSQDQLLLQTLSPQQLLAVQLLELTTLEIEDRVHGEIMDNPALEPVEQDDAPVSDTEEGGMDGVEDFLFDEDDYSGNDELPVSSGYQHYDMQVGEAVSFGDTLMEQLGELELTPEEYAVGEYIIGSLDEDGILRKSLSEIEDELLVYNNIATSEEQILSVLGKIQLFEPAGIAARSLQECLLLQLERVGRKRDLSLHKRIVSDYYDDFAGKRWEQLAEKLGLGEEVCRAAIADIVRLNPRPGASMTESVGFNRQQIIPDFVLEVQDGKVYVSLNNGQLPELKVSDEYVQMLEEQSKGDNREQREAAQFLKQKIDSARGFITAVKQREQTMLSTMRAIVAKQKEYFLSEGDEAMLKPMILEDIAVVTGYDISTISRVSNSKYVQTPWAVTPLKYFFSEGVTLNDGTEQSVYELYGVIREIIDVEDKKNPLTDQQLQELLAGRGYKVARRTVSKYREHLHIPVARLRKG